MIILIALKQTSWLESSISNLNLQSSKKEESVSDLSEEFSTKWTSMEASPLTFKNSSRLSPHSESSQRRLNSRHLWNSTTTTVTDASAMMSFWVVSRTSFQREDSIWSRKPSLDLIPMEVDKSLLLMLRTSMMCQWTQNFWKEERQRIKFSLISSLTLRAQEATTTHVWPGRSSTIITVILPWAPQATNTL